MVATPSAPGAQNLSSLTGQELVPVINAGPQSAVVTVRKIADLAGGGQTADIVNTSITTAGDGTLTAAGLVGGLITRTGPTANFNDTPATAAQIVTAIGTFVAGATFSVIIKNATAFIETLANSSGVTWPTTNIVGPFQLATYYGTIGGTSVSPTVAFTHLDTTPIGTSQSITLPASVTLSTVGAGTITAAGISAGSTLRTGSQSGTPFTDTTDIAASIIAGNVGLIGKIGSAVFYRYVNTTNALATLQGGTGVTVSQITTVPAGMTALYLLTYTAAATITLVGVMISSNVSTALELAGSTSGQAQIVATPIAGNTVTTLPPTTGTLASTSGTNLFVSDVYRTTAPVTANATVTPQTVTGLSGAVAVGTYRFRAYLPSTVASGTGGIAYNFLLTTAVLSAMECSGQGYTSAAVAVQHTTTATTGTVVFTQAAVVIETILEGTFVVSTAGTFAIQMAQNTSNASNTVALLGGYLELTRIA